MWNVGLYDLHALSRKHGSAGIYHDCAHLKTSATAFALYARLGAMLNALRAQVFEPAASANARLCASARCRAHNAAVMPPGAPGPEFFDFGSALPTFGTDGAAVDADAASSAVGAPLPQGGLTDDGRRRRRRLSAAPPARLVRAGAEPHPF